MRWGKGAAAAGSEAERNALVNRAFGNQRSRLYLYKALRRFDDLARFDTAGTDLHTSVAAGRELDPNGLKIRVETSPGLIVSVRDVVSKLRAFPANVAALCHIIASRRAGIRGVL